MDFLDEVEQAEQDIRSELSRVSIRYTDSYKYIIGRPGMKYAFVFGSSNENQW